MFCPSSATAIPSEHASLLDWLTVSHPAKRRMTVLLTAKSRKMRHLCRMLLFVSACMLVKQLTHFLDSPLLLSRQHVPIHTQGRRDLTVPEQLLHDLRRDSHRE